MHKALKTSPDPAQFPHTSRWYRHISSYENESSQLRGDPKKPYTAYGPEASKAHEDNEDDEDDEVDLFGSDDEEEDAEAVRIREERLAGKQRARDIQRTSASSRL